MSIVTTSNPYGRIKGVRKGDTFVHDWKEPIYLDGAQMQYTVYQHPGKVLAYFDTLEDAALFAGARNKKEHQP